MNLDQILVVFLGQIPGQNLVSWSDLGQLVKSGQVWSNLGQILVSYRQNCWSAETLNTHMPLLRCGGRLPAPLFPPLFEKH